MKLKAHANPPLSPKIKKNRTTGKSESSYIRQSKFVAGHFFSPASVACASVARRLTNVRKYNVSLFFLYHWIDVFFFCSAKVVCCPLRSALSVCQLAMEQKLVQHYVLFRAYFSNLISFVSPAKNGFNDDYYLTNAWSSFGLMYIIVLKPIKSADMDSMWATTKQWMNKKWMIVICRRRLLSCIYRAIKKWNKANRSELAGWLSCAPSLGVPDTELLRWVRASTRVHTPIQFSGTGAHTTVLLIVFFFPLTTSCRGWITHSGGQSSDFIIFFFFS